MLSSVTKLSVGPGLEDAATFVDGAGGGIVCDEVVVSKAPDKSNLGADAGASGELLVGGASAGGVQGVYNFVVASELAREEVLALTASGVHGVYNFVLASGLGEFKGAASGVQGVYEFEVESPVIADGGGLVLIVSM